jgi:hypothetical protein
MFDRNDRVRGWGTLHAAATRSTIPPAVLARADELIQ